MAGIKNVGLAAVEGIVAERQQQGAFKGLIDLTRADSQLVNRKTLESLVRCGAFDFTQLPRSRLFAGIEFAMKRSASLATDRRSGQGSLFDMLGGGTGGPKAEESQELPAADPWPASQDLSAEGAAPGFYISGHPVPRMHPPSSATACTTTPGWSRWTTARPSADGGGLVAGFNKRFTKKTGALWRVPPGDAGGLAGGGGVPRGLPRWRRARDEARVRSATRGQVEGQYKIEGGGDLPLTDCHRQLVDKVSVHLPAARCDDDKIRGLKTIFRSHPGETSVVICIEYPTGQKVFIGTRPLVQGGGRGVCSAHEVNQLLGEDSCYLQVKQEPILRPRNGSATATAAAAAAGRIMSWPAQKWARDPRKHLPPSQSEATGSAATCADRFFSPPPEWGDLARPTARGRAGSNARLTARPPPARPGDELRRLHVRLLNLHQPRAI